MAFGVALTAVGESKRRKAEKNQIRAEEAKREREQRLADIKASRERKKIIREARIKQGEILAKSGGKGGLESSAVLGASGSLAAQTAGELGYIGQQQEIGTQIAGLQSEIAESEREAAVGQSIFNIGVQYGSDITEFAEANIFGDKKAT